jgi:hypothetical protein
VVYYTRRMELEETTGEFQPAHDLRPRIPEPLPVRLVAVEDVRLPAPPDVESKLDAFYVGLLEFERIAGGLTYRAENFLLRFEVRPTPVVHESMRPLGVEVISLGETEKKLIAIEMEYVRQRGTTPGLDSLLVLDPAGNWVEIVEYRPVQ